MTGEAYAISAGRETVRIEAREFCCCGDIFDSLTRDPPKRPRRRRRRVQIIEKFYGEPKAHRYVRRQRRVGCSQTH